MAKVQNGKDILPKVSTPWLRLMNVTDETDRQTTDGCWYQNSNVT